MIKQGRDDCEDRRNARPHARGARHAKRAALLRAARMRRDQNSAGRYPGRRAVGHAITDDTVGRCRRESLLRRRLPGVAEGHRDQLIRVYGNTAVNSGYYTFSYTKDGETKSIPARYSFTYVKD